MKTSWLFGLVLAAVLVATPAAAKVDGKSLDIDSSSPVNLQFGGGKIRVEGWDGRRVMVTPSSIHQVPFELEQDGNTISYDFDRHATCFPEINRGWAKSGEPHFTVLVPRGVVTHVQAHTLYARDGSLIGSVSGVSAVLRDCTLAAGFHGQGTSLSVDRVTGQSPVRFEYGQGEIKRSTLPALTFSRSGNGPGPSFSIERSRIGRLSVCADISLLVYRSSVSTFSVGRDVAGGHALFVCSALGRVENRSALRIHRLFVW